MNKAYKSRIAESKSRLDTELANVVKKIRHHKREHIKEYIRQRCNVSIDDDYLTQLIERTG